MDLSAAALPVCVPVRSKVGETLYKEMPEASFNEVDAEIAYQEKRSRKVDAYPASRRFAPTLQLASQKSAATNP